MDNSELERRLQESQLELEHRCRQIEAMRRTSSTLFSHLEEDDLLRETLCLAIDVLRADAGTILLYHHADDTLVFRHVIGPAAAVLTGYAMPASASIPGHVFQTGVPELVPNVRERADFIPLDGFTGYHVESLMCAPIRAAEGKPLGVMGILNAQVAFDERDLEVMDVLCSVAGAALENERLAREARKAQIINIIGDISHDIKNMLTPVQTGAWTLQSLLDEMFGALDAFQATYAVDDPRRAEINRIAAMAREDYSWILQAALEAADQVQARTKEIADAIKGEAAPPQFEMTDYHAIVQEVARALRLVTEKAGLQLMLDLDDAVPPMEVDRRQMYNALYNLVNNAIPEVPEGGTITIRTRRRDEGSTLMVQVRDTGRGMPEHVRERLFTEKAISTRPNGTGLGTRIVADVVRRHNGTISVESTEGKGSIFTMLLPLRQPVAGHIQ